MVLCRERYRGALAIITLAWPFLVCGEATADVVRAASRVNRFVNIRSAPSTTSEIIGTLPRGQELELVADGNPWRELRLVGSNLRGWVSADYTRVLRSPATVQSQQLTLPVESNRLQVAVRQGPPEEKILWIIPVSLAGSVVALCSVLILCWSVLQTNIRSRNETFRVLRERFEDLRNTEGMRQAFKTTPPTTGATQLGLYTTPVRSPKAAIDPNSAVRQQALSDVLTRLPKALEKVYGGSDKVTDVITAVNVVPDQAAQAEDWAHTISRQERYWIRAFDEWYITTGGGLYLTNKVPKAVIVLRRLVGVYRSLWDEYYREAIAGTVKDNPMMMVALWHAYRDGHAEMDKTFVRDMWTICKDHDTAIQDAGNRWNNLVTTIQTHSPDTALREVTPPSFLDLKWPQANASIGCEIPAPVGT